MSTTTTPKEMIVKAVQELPEDASFEDAFEKLLLLHKIEMGMAQYEAGDVVSHEEAKVLLQKWLA